MKFLLDGNVLLWDVFSPDELTERAKAILRDLENELIVSHASLWEPVVKLVLVEPKRKSHKDIIGRGIGKIWVSPDFDSKQTDNEIADLFENCKDHFG